MSKKNKKKEITPSINSAAVSEAKSYTLNLGNVLAKYWLYLVILTVLVFVVYSISLGNGFVSDDKGISQEGARFFTPQYIFADPLNFLGRFFQGVEYLISGTNPLFYRLVNVSAHLGNTILVFIILLVLNKPRPAFFTAALFAVHPLMTEAVTWISGGNYAHAAFLFLLSFLFYILSSSKPKLYWVSLGIFIFGLLYSNRVMTLFPIFALYEIAFGDIRKNWKKLIPYVVLSLIWGLSYFINVSNREGEVTKGGNVASYVYNPLFYLPFSLSWYFELIFFPNRLSFYHSNIDVTGGEMVLRWLVFLTYLGAVGYTFFKNKTLFFWLSFFTLSLLLFLTPFQIAWVVADRYVYLGTIGILAVVGYGFGYLAKFKKTRILVYIGFGLLIAILGARTIVRNFDWKNEDTLMTATLRTNPENAKVHNHIGTIYGKKKDYANAMKEFEIAEKLDPGLPDTYHNMGNSYYEQKDFEKAIPFFEKAVQVDPNHWMSYQILANIYYDRGEYAKVAEYITKILPINPNPQLYTNLGVVYLKAGEKEKAKQAFRTALQMDPTNTFAAQAVNDIDNPALLGTESSNSAPDTSNPAMPNGSLPPEVLKALQEQQQKAASSVPTTIKSTPVPTVKP